MILFYSLLPCIISSRSAHFGPLFRSRIGHFCIFLWPFLLVRFGALVSVSTGVRTIYRGATGHLMSFPRLPSLLFTLQASSCGLNSSSASRFRSRINSRLIRRADLRPTSCFSSAIAFCMSFIYVRREVCALVKGSYSIVGTEPFPIQAVDSVGQRGLIPFAFTR